MQEFINGVIIAFIGLATMWIAAYARGFGVEFSTGLIDLIDLIV